MPSIQDLPFEILSTILHFAAESNALEGTVATYTYGLTEAPRPLGKSQPHKYVRGRVPDDILRWRASDSLRRVCSTWHDWAIGYSMKKLYIRRWRGGESWDTTFVNRDHPRGGPTAPFPVVYRDPYRHLRKTAALLADFPSLALAVRSLWFNGIYIRESVRFVYSIASSCTNLRSLSAPWSTLRFLTGPEWAHLLSFPRLTALEFNAVDMRLAQLIPENQIDELPLHHPAVDFSTIRRIKFQGFTNVNPLTDSDLALIAHTATSLEALTIRGTRAISFAGVQTLAAASAAKLQLLDFTPEVVPTTAPAGALVFKEEPHYCTLFTPASMPKLTDLNITLPTLCPAFFTHLPAMTPLTPLTIRTASIACGSTPTSHAQKAHVLKTLLEASRAYSARTGVRVEIRVLESDLMFVPDEGLVHGDFGLVRKTSGGRWMGANRGETSVRGAWGKGAWEVGTEGQVLGAVGEGVLSI
ncbi:hypothetical protein BJ508DRAFT_416322 [Ascobolus immersus RN42]|uniref:F-box domain-containing protein n=1 Tax=Ascobolus immersus RN42 TaxID=1160509 RepID=A0A3N4I075_ASCIM|nr:hypothetical protein BJ508DRAFT_416322 [Ascobolus immersus RN42]